MSKYSKVEKEQKFSPIKSDYERFIEKTYGSRMKEIPKIGAKMPERKQEVERMQQKMQRSLGMESKPSKPTPRQQPATRPQPEKETPAIKERREPKYIAGYEKAGKPSKIRVISRPESSPKQIEARKRMLRMQKGKR
jgi:hypothetical protein